MDLSKEYRVMCKEAHEIQNRWKPEVGDYLVALAGYCYKEGVCADHNPCPDCLVDNNVFVISGEFQYAQEVGGHHWFFGGSACAKGPGYVINDTHCYVMTETGKSNLSHSCSTPKDKLWLPRQDQIQNMSLSGLKSPHMRLRDFTKWLDEVDYHPYSSLEVLWLMFFMEKTYNKKWNSMKNIWEQI